MRSARRRSSATAAAGATSANPQVTIARKFFADSGRTRRAGASATVSARAMRTPSSTISSAGMWKPISGTITSPAGVPPAPLEEMLESTPSIAPLRRSPAMSNSLRPSQSPIRKPVATSSELISRTSTNASRRRSSATLSPMNCAVSGA